jgi:hypothetical protein
MLFKNTDGSDQARDLRMKQFLTLFTDIFKKLDYFLPLLCLNIIRVKLNSKTVLFKWGGFPDALGFLEWQSVEPYLMKVLCPYYVRHIHDLEQGDYDSWLNFYHWLLHTWKCVDTFYSWTVLCSFTVEWVILGTHIHDWKWILMKQQ